ncbi:MAG: nicotinate-nucleotide--dimethylbenzimidazole phosphoribosyltransferase [Chloroflexi bacterium]|nr:nicotinate-nucleotide--dimethylbenzimidazole phosphoribosyltransferase [Chloroflexota bacterium]
MTLLTETIGRVGTLATASMHAARARQLDLTKPAGSLGRLEALHVQLAGIRADPLPVVTHKAVIIMAGDHGVVVEGVSAYPAEVTSQMVLNFVHGGAAINVLARAADARVVIVNAGVGSPLPDLPDMINTPVARGTRNMAREAAMTRSEATAAIELGIRVLEQERARGLDLVATGDMGIGNTTASAAIVAALCGAPVAQVTGRGTGVDDAGLVRKREAIQRALDLLRPDPADPLDVLSKVGGLEIAGLIGVILGAAAERLPIVVDGFISGAAALVAVELCPAVRSFLIAAHSSVEIGHHVVLEKLELAPLLQLDLRLGEGTGAALAFPLIEAACRIPREMATFSEAGVAQREDSGQPAGQGA